MGCAGDSYLLFPPCHPSTRMKRGLRLLVQDRRWFDAPQPAHGPTFEQYPFYVVLQDPAVGGAYDEDVAAAFDNTTARQPLSPETSANIGLRVRITLGRLLRGRQQGCTTRGMGPNTPKRAQTSREGACQGRAQAGPKRAQDGPGRAQTGRNGSKRPKRAHMGPNRPKSGDLLSPHPRLCTAVGARSSLVLTIRRHVRGRRHVPGRIDGAAALVLPPL